MKKITANRSLRLALVGSSALYSISRHLVARATLRNDVLVRPLAEAAGLAWLGVASLKENEVTNAESYKSECNWNDEGRKLYFRKLYLKWTSAYSKPWRQPHHCTSKLSQCCPAINFFKLSNDLNFGQDTISPIIQKGTYTIVAGLCGIGYPKNGGQE